MECPECAEDVDALREEISRLTNDLEEARAESQKRYDAIDSIDTIMRKVYP